MKCTFKKIKKQLYFKNSYRDLQKISRDLSSGGLELFSIQNWQNCLSNKRTELKQSNYKNIYILVSNKAIIRPNKFDLQEPQ